MNKLEKHITPLVDSGDYKVLKRVSEFLQRR